MRSIFSWTRKQLKITKSIKIESRVVIVFRKNKPYKMASFEFRKNRQTNRFQFQFFFSNYTFSCLPKRVRNEAPTSNKYKKKKKKIMRIKNVKQNESAMTLVKSSWDTLCAWGRDRRDEESRSDVRFNVERPRRA